MKSLFVFSISFFLYINLFSQFSKTTITRIDLSKDIIFDKISGKRLTEEELVKIKLKNPRARFQPIFNKYGEPDHFIYDPFLKDSDYNIDISNRAKNGDSFPPFVMNTINDEIIDSEELQGKFILMMFELTFDNSYFDNKILSKANAFINDVKNITEIVSLVITLSDKSEILNSVKVLEYNMDFVPDADNFYKRYFVFSGPAFILIDKNGKLVSYYEYDEFSQMRSDILKNN